MMAEVETRTVEADEAGMRLDRWFRAHYPDLAFGHLQKLLRSGQVRVDGGRAKTSTRLDPGMSVRIPPIRTAPGGEQPPPGTSPRRERPEVAGNAPAAGQATAKVAAPAIAKGGKAGDLLRNSVLYEDDEVLVFNKPFGLAVQGGSGLTTHVDALLEAWRDHKGQKPRLVHRLDRDTTGVLIVARTRLAAAKLSVSFKSRTSKKIYWALVAGVPKPKQGRISTWLAKEGGPEGEKMKVAKHGDDDASHAVSFYSVLDTAGTALSWLTMRPVTGRTHQLRAHAAHIGHPIVGDPKYFNLKDWELPGGIQNRLHLHARRLQIPHPSGGQIDVTAPLSPHMVQSWNLLGFDVDLGIEPDSED